MGIRHIKLGFHEDRIDDRTILDFIDTAPRTAKGKLRLKPWITEALLLGIAEQKRKNEKEKDGDEKEREDNGRDLRRQTKGNGTNRQRARKQQKKKADPADRNPVENVSNLAGLNFD